MKLVIEPNWKGALSKLGVEVAGFGGRAREPFGDSVRFDINKVLLLFGNFRDNKSPTWFLETFG